MDTCVGIRALAVVMLILPVGCQGTSFPPLPSDPLLPTGVAGVERRPRADTVELTRQVSALVEAFSRGSAIWIADAGDPRPLYSRNADDEVVAASLYKLGVLVHAEGLVDRREASYEDTITIANEDVTDEVSHVVPGAEVTLDEALELMITQSDNGTALALRRMYGPDAINATLERLKLKGLRIGGADEDNVATARGVGELLTRMAERTLVSSAASDRMIARLQRQAVTGRSDAHLPPGTRLAHKTGDLPGLAHDAAILFTTIGPRVVVVLTWDADETNYEFIARVALAAYETAR